MHAIVRRHRRWVLVLLGLIALYALVGFFVVPPIARHQLVQRAEERLEREVDLDGVRFNPFTLRASLEGLRVVDHDGELLGSLDAATFNFDAWNSLFRQQWQLGDAALQRPYARIVIDESGELNVGDLAPDDRDDEPPPRVGVESLLVEDGRVELIDRSTTPTFTSSVHPIGFALENFSTAPDASGGYRLAGTTDAGERFSWAGRIAVDPLSSEGRVAVEQVHLPKYMPFLAPLLAAEITRGRATLTTDYRVRLAEGNREVVMTDTEFVLSDLRVEQSEADEPVLELAQLRVAAPSAHPLERAARVARVEIEGPAVRVVRAEDGAINLLELARASGPDDVPPDDPGDAGAAEDLDIRVEHVELNGGRVLLVDRALAEPVRIQLEQLRMVARGAGSDLNRPVEVEAGWRWADDPGSLTVEGTVRPQPLRVQLAVEGEQIAVAPLSPYLAGLAEVRMTDGRASISGQVQLAQGDDPPWQARWTGGLSLDAFAAEALDSGETLVAWQHLGINGVDFELAPMRLAVEELRLAEPTVDAILREDGSFNLAEALGSGALEGEDGEAPAPEEEAGLELPLELRVDAVVVEGGRLRLDDRSFAPAFELEVTDFGGRIRHIANRTDEPAVVELSASVAGSAPLTLSGTIDLFGGDLLSGSELVADLRNLRLQLFEPYAARFLGYRIEQGRMQGDFEYTVEGGDLTGSNRVLLNDFFLGEEVESPQALSVPVKLGLAVLRDRDDQIQLDVPVNGSLRSPEFSFGSIVQEAFSNSLVKAATAPFALLGSLFGGEDEDLGAAELPPGEPVLGEDARQNLNALAQALQERPRLAVRIHWAPSPEADREWLADQRLNELIEEERQRLEQQEGGGVEVGAEQALASLYRTQVGPLDEAPSTPGEAEEAGAAQSEERVAEDEPESSERRPWYARLGRFLFGSSDQPATEDQPVADGQPVPEAEGLPDPAVMREALLAQIEVDPQEAAALARQRAETARGELLAAGIEPERVQVASEAGRPEGREPTDVPAIFFSLDVAGPQLAAE